MLNIVRSQSFTIENTDIFWLARMSSLWNIKGPDSHRKFKRHVKLPKFLL